MPEIIAPVHLDIQIPSKADYTLEFQLTDEDGDVVDIGTETVILTVYRKRTDTVPLLEMTNGPGDHSTPSQGKTAFEFVPSDSDWMEKEEELALYELWRVYDGDTKRFPWFRGGMLFGATRGTGDI